MAAAYEIILKEGAEHLTMRRLAATLGSTAMAVYHHVRDKDELLSLVLEHVAHTLPRPPLPDDPRERVVVVCGLMHQAFAEHPWVVPILARGELVGMSAVWMTEEILGALTTYGLDREEAFWAHQTLWYYTAGRALATPPRLRPEPDDASGRHYPETTAAQDTAARYPHVTSYAEDSRELEDRYTYEQGIRHILDGVLGD
ncbi:TetR/AcrR family transcriptional regulator [Streptomyces sp. URMC 126]|uniref:TetR/AcrR family transcriptional regulator n=1 Tax=Streptomyces sp. URMC 126 TaxID=3423401 RepID=UPI003F1CF5BC